MAFLTSHSLDLMIDLCFPFRTLESFYILLCENFGHLCINVFICYPGRLGFENGLPPERNIFFYFVFAE